MRQGLFALIFFALTMVVMAAPTNNTMIYKRQPKSCARRNTNKVANNKKSAPNHGVASSSKPASKGPASAPKAKNKSQRRPRDFDELEELDVRAPSIKLCDIPFRGTSANNGCDNKKGFYQSKWTEWDSYKSRVSIDHLECDHALELQLTVKALEGAGFCTQWNKMKAAWAKYDKNENDVVSKMKAAMTASGGLKEVANSPQMKFYVSTEFNGKKRAWVSNLINGRKNDALATQELKPYFSAETISLVDQVATQIDKSAHQLLAKIVALATDGISDDPAKQTTEQSDLSCELELAQEDFSDHKDPVKTLWNQMKGKFGN